MSSLNFVGKVRKFQICKFLKSFFRRKNFHKKFIFRTKEAMTGSMTFQEALRRRLDIIKPTQRQIKDFLESRPSTMSQGIR